MNQIRVRYSLETMYLNQRPTVWNEIVQLLVDQEFQIPINSFKSNYIRTKMHPLNANFSLNVVITELRRTADKLMFKCSS